MSIAYENTKALKFGKNEIEKYELADFYGGKKSLSHECIFHDNDVR